MKQTFALGIVLVLATLIYTWGAHQQSTLVNTNKQSNDQSAYMNYAKAMARTNFEFVGGRAKMPVYPALMSLFFNEGMPDDDFFKRGKQVGIALGLIGLMVTFLLFSSVAPVIDALTGTLVAAFTVFVYKAPYFQAEILFYTFNLMLFYLILSLLKKPLLKTAALTGLVGGLAHLTKASVLPALFLTTLLLSIRGTMILYQHRYRDKAPTRDSFGRLALQQLSYVLVLLTCFLLVIFPYIKTSKQHFGQYFYNVSSTFYIWYDSWEEAERGTKAYDDRKGWPTMPKEEIPSFRKYIREHSVGEIIGRFTNGFFTLYRKTTQSYGYTVFLFTYGLALGLLFLRNKSFYLTYLRSVRPWPILFIGGYFLSYTTLYAWYTLISNGNRFILSLFLPGMFVIISLLSHAKTHHLSYHTFAGKKISASIISPIILFLLIEYLLIIFPHRIATMYAGS